MSIVNEFRATQAAIKELEERLAALKQSDALQKELEFEGKLRELLAQYGKALPDVIALLDSDGRVSRTRPAAKEVAAPAKRTRRVKRYSNPHTGEVIETKGGNHNTLKEWKAKWGGDEVEGWSTILD